jgi:hypothetical protein
MMLNIYGRASKSALETETQCDPAAQAKGTFRFSGSIEAQVVRLPEQRRRSRHLQLWFTRFTILSQIDGGLLR